MHVPTSEEEDQRQLHRELMALTAERTRHINRIKGLFNRPRYCVASPNGLPFSSGGGSTVGWLETALWAAFSASEYERLQLFNQQIRQLDHSRMEAIRTSTTPAVEQVRQLLRLKAIGMNSAWVYVMEFFSWRNFHNRREVGSLAGLTPTPYQSGESAHEQGISKAGNRRIRAMAIEIAWVWLRYQPDSQLSHCVSRTLRAGQQSLYADWHRRTARRLLIELWKYLETAIPPEGAVLKTL